MALHTTRFPSFLGYAVHEDWQNTVWALSNTSAVVVERYEQDDPFGKSHTLDASGNNLGSFASQVHHRKRMHGGVVDEVTGLYDFRNRWYSPTSGSWLSRDPLGQVDSENLYQGILARPLVSTDYFGERTTKCTTIRYEIYDPRSWKSIFIGPWRREHVDSWKVVIPDESEGTTCALRYWQYVETCQKVLSLGEAQQLIKEHKYDLALGVLGNAMGGTKNVVLSAATTGVAMAGGGVGGFKSQWCWCYLKAWLYVDSLPSCKARSGQWRPEHISASDFFPGGGEGGGMPGGQPWRIIGASFSNGGGVLGSSAK